MVTTTPRFQLLEVSTRNSGLAMASFESDVLTDRRMGFSGALMSLTMSDADSRISLVVLPYTVEFQPTSA